MLTVGAVTSSFGGSDRTQGKKGRTVLIPGTNTGFLLSCLLSIWNILPLKSKD